MSKKTNRKTKKAIAALKRKRSNRASYVSGGRLAVETPQGRKTFQIGGYNYGGLEGVTDETRQEEEKEAEQEQQ
jgi:hypothetical protein